MLGKILTRRAMYDLVWSKPMTKVAEDLQISDVALRKICDRHRVPTPSRGYWAKKAAGKPVVQTHFFETSDSAVDRIEIHSVVAHLPRQVQDILHRERGRRQWQTKHPVIDAPAAVEQPLAEVHHAVAATARALRKGKPNKTGVVEAVGEGHCGISAGTLSVERVVSVLDGLVRQLEARGLQLRPLGSKIGVTDAPDSVFLMVKERVDMEKHVPTPQELAEEERRERRRERDIRSGRWEYGAYDRPYPEYDPVRTGELSIQIENEYLGGLRRTWGDGKIQRLENLTEGVASGVVLYLAGIRARREERQRSERRWARQMQVRALAAARAEREVKRQEFVREQVRLASELAGLAACRIDHDRIGAATDLDRLDRLQRAQIEGSGQARLAGIGVTASGHGRDTNPVGRGREPAYRADDCSVLPVDHGENLPMPSLCLWPRSRSVAAWCRSPPRRGRSTS
ncbi:MAG: hypothetical protein WDN69_12460 [Aliidongia sp.]